MSHTANGVQNGQPAGAHDLGTTGDQPLQDPIAVVGFACRLPDECDTPQAFWKFLERGGVAKNDPPPSRYNIKTHYDGTRKEKTMASPGGMYLQNVDVRDLDAQFFKLSRLEAISMDPQQRQLLEVVYEGLENSGITLKQLDNRPIGCFVGSFACDYGDIQARDPMDRAPATVVGIGRAMLSNRISHFLNIKGPSMTIDTACSGSLTGLDVACRYLQAGEIEGAIIGGANIYMSPEHVMDWHMGSGGTASHSGKCHTFDAKADGYIKAEAINMVYIKRPSDALRDGDPIRAIIRGSAVNSDGWTAGIASPNSDAQAAAIRRAYANAGIKDLSLTGYVECHGTGTRAGDVIEVKGVSSVFREFRPKDTPLRIGSVKSNIGHSEPAAGISGLLKAILALENGVIPGNPTFIDPNPNLDFDELRVLPSRTAIPWPSNTMKRASVNSFGYGGSNAHVIVDAAEGLSNHVSSYGVGRDDYDMFDDDTDEALERPYLAVLSANDAPSLQAQLGRLDKHLSDPAVRVKMRDLAYTLAGKRSRHFHRGYTVPSSTAGLGSAVLTKGTTRESPPSMGFVFTGQGAQWPAMGKQLLETYPVAANTVRHLDEVLQELDNPPSWTLWDTLTQPLTGEELKSPELSQPAVTALQLAILGVLSDAGVSPTAVVGHSSGEIAAAMAAGHLSPKQAIKIAYFRGRATTKVRPSAPLGMLAVGLGAESTQRYLAGTEAEIACINSPESVTVSGYSSELVVIEAAIKADGKFARLLQVKAAYHSRHMLDVGRLYKELLTNQVEWDEACLPSVTMVSSTTGDEVSFNLGPDYWVQNMVSPVLFSQAAGRLIAPGDAAVDILIEIGPSGALAGPVGQIKKLHKSTSEYHAAWKRDDAPLEALLSLAGQLFIAGHPIDITKMNQDSEVQAPSLVVDLPNYSWNHSVQYWAENEASADWRYRDFVHHDLLGTKILGTSWQTPTWKKIVNVQEEPWLADHMIGESVIFPASGYIAMAIEALYQRTMALGRLPVDCGVSEQTYRLRDVRFDRALSLDNKDRDVKMLLSLTERRGTAWHEFRISSIGPDRESDQEHCRGLVSIVQFEPESADAEQLAPLQHGTPANTWYKAMREVGYSFGPSFRGYSLTLATQNAGLEARTRYGAAGGVKFVVHDDPDAPKDDGGAFDVAIIQVPALHTLQDVQALLQDDDGSLGGAGLVIVISYQSTATITNGQSNQAANGQYGHRGGREDGNTNGKNGHGSMPHIAGFESVIPISNVPNGTGTPRLGLVFVGRKPSVSVPLSEGQAAHVVHLEDRSQEKDALISSLSGVGLTITQHTELPAEVPEGSTVLVLDEVFSPVFSSIRDDQLAMIQELMRRQCRLLWVTSGGHMNVTNPEHSLFDPTCLVMTVDIESSTSSSSTQAILQTMRHLESVDNVEFFEREWVERGGVPYVSRVVPNSVINKAEEDELAAAEPVVKSLFRNEPVTRLINTRIGSLDGLVFAEVEDPVGPRDVEVEIHAAALNFKDLAHIMGFLPSNEERLGLECAGVVSALGAEASARTNLKRGDRVVLIHRDGGCFENRVRSRYEDVSKIPDSWGFEEAAGVGVCFMTAVYGLIDLANIRDGQTVLIHSAAGGVGLACLQICAQYDVEVYVTVGTEEKRKFIRDEFGIPDDHMFTSRSTAFAQQLMDATKGRGVDIVMNSLAGDLLHESWRCIADNGTFVEIGKKDILERNALSIEPFDRNASYRAFDLSTLCKDHAIAHRLTDYIFSKGQEGSIWPIHICKTFAWDNIVDALRYMRDGKHIGKIVISSPGHSAVKVPVRPMAAKTTLRPDVPYLIVGGFKGLCASLAIYMAREGARHLVIMARSGYTDQTSQATLMHLSALGCRVDLVQGDVTVMADVERAVTAAGKPLAGIIMGAMVLKDGMFDTVTGENFRAPIDPKVKGAWNLHRATLAHDTPLDFFTLLSSISGVGGQRAQTNYSAGNAFLDAFAVWRHAQGLPVCSVDLGIIEDVGYFTDRDAMAARLRMQGWTPINEALLHRILRLSLLQQSANPVDPDTTAQIITGIPNPLGPNSPQKPVHRFSALRPRSATEGASAGDSDLALLRNAANGQGADIEKATQLAAAVSAVNGVLTMSLGLNEPLEPTRPLKTYGIDSLVAVELRNLIRTELSIELSALEIVGAVTLVALCEVILKKLLR